jgi:hypothetical protein
LGSETVVELGLGLAVELDAQEAAMVSSVFHDLFGVVYDASLTEQRISPRCFVFGSDCVTSCWMDYAWAALIVSTES